MARYMPDANVHKYCTEGWRRKCWKLRRNPTIDRRSASQKANIRAAGTASALGAVTMANAANGRNDRAHGGNAACTGCALPRRAAARRLATLTSERLIAALTIALEADVIDGLMAQTIDVAEELTGLSELPATPTVMALRAEKSAEYRRLAAETNTVMGSKAECYAILRGDR